MNYEEEISYRKKLLERVRNGERITSEDREWLVTHRIYNRILGYPYLNSDIIHLQPKVNYYLRVKVENRSYFGRIIPVINVPGGKGQIVTNKHLTDYNGSISYQKGIKTLGLLNDLDHKETVLSYRSSLGLLGISYECDFFDDKQQIMLRKNSCIGDPNFAMYREVLSINKVLYRCKAPINDSFESLEFSIEWEVAFEK